MQTKLHYARWAGGIVTTTTEAMKQAGREMGPGFTILIEAAK